MWHCGALRGRDDKAEEYDAQQHDAARHQLLQCRVGRDVPIAHLRHRSWGVWENAWLAAIDVGIPNHAGHARCTGEVEARAAKHYSQPVSCRGDGSSNIVHSRYPLPRLASSGEVLAICHESHCEICSMRQLYLTCPCCAQHHGHVPANAAHGVEPCVRRHTVTSTSMGYEAGHSKKVLLKCFHTSVMQRNVGILFLTASTSDARGNSQRCARLPT